MHIFIIKNKVDYVVTYYLIFKLFNGTERKSVKKITRITFFDSS
jgi:hypothetical protein